MNCPTDTVSLTNDLQHFVKTNGIFVNRSEVIHRVEEFDPNGFNILFKMQREHFWYAGRHHFILHEFKKIRSLQYCGNAIKAIDLGGGCGGWIDYLLHTPNVLIEELALGDSSRLALTLAKDVVGNGVNLFEVDLLDLPWQERWDIIFLLDVIEHIPDESEVLRQCMKALRSNGIVIVTAPALKFFWSYNDEVAKHLRRYCIADFEKLADETGFELIDSRYFMFFLSPLLWISRLFAPNIRKMTQEQIQRIDKKSHRIPCRPINKVFKCIFSLESLLSVKNIRVPWGTSVLGVFLKR